MSITAHVGAGAPTRPAGAKPGRFLSKKNRRALLARPDGDVRAYVFRAYFSGNVRNASKLPASSNPAPNADDVHAFFKWTVGTSGLGGKL